MDNVKTPSRTLASLSQKLGMLHPKFCVEDQDLPLIRGFNSLPSVSPIFEGQVIPRDGSAVSNALSLEQGVRAMEGDLAAMKNALLIAKDDVKSELLREGWTQDQVRDAFGEALPGYY